MASNASGNVTVEIDGVKYNRAALNGQAVFDIENLTAGVKSVAASYIEDDIYLFNSTTAQFRVGKRPSVVNVTAGPVNVGETEAVNITGPSDYNGMVLVNVNGTVYSVNLTGGRGQLNITNLLSGNYSVNVTLIENEKYLSNSNKTSFTVSKRDSFLNVVTMPIATGENEVIRFTLPGDATGNITVTVDKVIHTVAVSGGAGILVISNLHQGIYTVNATYNGDNKYNRYVNDPQSFRVIQHSDEMDIVDEGNRTVLVHLNENATGNVTIEINGEVYNATVINGTATIILTDTVPGIHRAHVKFNSNSTEFEDKEAIAELFVPKYTTPITVEVSEFKVDDAGYINVTLPHDATGMVIVEVNGKSFNTTDIVNGVCYCKSHIRK